MLEETEILRTEIREFLADTFAIEPWDRNSDFGVGFSENFISKQPGIWLGPFNSIYGTHLVKISQIIEAKSPDLKEVKKAVLTDYLLEQKQDSTKNYIEALKKDYEVQINPKFNYQD